METVIIGINHDWYFSFSSKQTIDRGYVLPSCCCECVKGWKQRRVKFHLGPPQFTGVETLQLCLDSLEADG